MFEIELSSQGHNTRYRGMDFKQQSQTLTFGFLYVFFFLDLQFIFFQDFYCPMP